MAIPELIVSKESEKRLNLDLSKVSINHELVKESETTSKVCVHVTFPPVPHRWDYPEFVVVVVVSKRE